MGDRFKIITDVSFVWDIKRSTAVTIFLAEFLLPSLLLCYGPWFQQLATKHELNPKSDSLYTPFLFYFSWSIGNPISRYICEFIDIGNKCYVKWILYVAVAIISGGIMLSSLGTSSINLNIGYGLMGGFGTSVYLTFVNFHLYEEFNKVEVLNFIIQSGRSISLLCFPFILQYLFLKYGIERTFFIWSAVLLHGIPIILLCKISQKRENIYSNIQSIDNLKRYQSTARMVFNNKLMAYNLEEENEPFENALSFNSRNWKSPSDIEDETSSLSSNTMSEIEEENEFNNYDKGDENEHNILEDVFIAHFTYKNSSGVDILPEIPEEDEELGSNNSRRNSHRQVQRFSLKRLSHASTKFNELIKEGQESEDSRHEPALILDVNHCVNESIDKEDAIQPMNSFLDEMSTSKRTSNCCIPYRKYLLKRWVRVSCIQALNFFVKPIISACKIIEFYPCLLGRVVESVSAIVVFSTLPYIAVNFVKHEKISIEKSTFLLTLTSFAWLFVTIIATPWIIRFTKLKVKILHVIGIFLTGFTTLRFSSENRYSTIAVYSLLYGISYGITSISGGVMLKEVLGTKSYFKIESALDIISGILVLPFFYLFFDQTNEVNNWYFIISILNIVTSIGLILADLIKSIYLLRKRQIAQFK